MASTGQSCDYLSTQRQGYTLGKNSCNPLFMRFFSSFAHREKMKKRAPAPWILYLQDNLH